jgi:hypothetical protein
MDLVIDRATILEWPQIDALRNNYRDIYPKLPWGCETDDSATWWVCLAKERVLGAYSYVDMLGIRWISDFYIQEISRFQRVKIAFKMRDHVYEVSSECGLPLAAMISCSNDSQISFMRKRTMARPLSVIYYEPGRRNDGRSA